MNHLNLVNKRLPDEAFPKKETLGRGGGDQLSFAFHVGIRGALISFLANFGIFKPVGSKAQVWPKKLTASHIVARHHFLCYVQQ